MHDHINRISGLFLKTPDQLPLTTFLLISHDCLPDRLYLSLENDMFCKFLTQWTFNKNVYFYVTFVHPMWLFANQRNQSAFLSGEVFFFFSTELRFFFSTMQLTLAACTWHHFLASLESSCCQSVDNLGTHFSSVCLVYSWELRFCHFPFKCVYSHRTRNPLISFWQYQNKSDTHLWSETYLQLSHILRSQWQVLESVADAGSLSLSWLSVVIKTLNGLLAHGTLTHV